MIKEIVKDKFLLSLKSEPATKNDASIITDLIDTIEANKDRCVGMAANMIGYNKTILIYLDENNKYEIMVNPEIINKIIPYKVMEGCLSHTGQKEAVRYKKIKVKYLDKNFKVKIKTFTEFTAEIIQHEMDHFEGILI